MQWDRRQWAASERRREPACRFGGLCENGASGKQACRGHLRTETPERFAIRASSPSDTPEDGAYWPGQISAHKWLKNFPEITALGG